jgi:hypothetical protein
VIKVGDICMYSYHDVPENNSLCIVKVIEIKGDSVCSVKFLKVIRDDSGNDLFNYLLKTNGEMNVTNKYLTKIADTDEVIQTVTNALDRVIREMVKGIFDDGEVTCKINNCYKSSDEVTCGEEICINENVEYWKKQIVENLKVLFCD